MVRWIHHPQRTAKSNASPSDLIATLGETTATPWFICRLRDAMLSSPTGRRILRDRPRITSQTMSMQHLRTLPENSVGRAYASWLDNEGVSPDTRDQVRFIDDEECAYVMQRYRECHDFYHAVTGLPVMVEGEIALKGFEFANTLLPMTGLSLFAVARLKLPERSRFWRVYLPWAVTNGLRSKEIINVYWEEQLEHDVDDLRLDLGMERPPDLRETRKVLREQRKAAEEKMQRVGGLRTLRTSWRPSDPCSHLYSYRLVVDVKLSMCNLRRQAMLRSASCLITSNTCRDLDSPDHSSSRSSSSSQPPFRLLTTIFPPVIPSRSLFSATAPRRSLSWPSVTLARSCPDRASMIKRFSISVARDSFTSRIRPSRSAASGWSIWTRMEARASAGVICNRDGSEVKSTRRCTNLLAVYTSISEGSTANNGA